MLTYKRFMSLLPVFPPIIIAFPVMKVFGSFLQSNEIQIDNISEVIQWVS